MIQTSSTTLPTAGSSSSELSAGVSDLCKRIASRLRGAWFVTGTYARSQTDPLKVTRHFREWLRTATLESAAEHDPKLARRIPRTITNKTPTEAGHKLVARARVSSWQGKCKRKMAVGEWHPDYCMAIEPHASESGLHWHAVISDPRPPAPFALDFESLRSGWLHHGRVKVDAIRGGDDEQAIGYTLKALSYTFKSSTDGYSFELSKGLTEALKSSHEAPSII